MSLVLASGSRARFEMLQAAGIKFEIQKAYVDEEPVKAALRAEGASAHNIADALAELKAMAVSQMRDEDYIIGADQILSSDGVCFSKAENMVMAKKHLQSLSGKKHSLTSAVVIARHGRVLWRATDKAYLTMRSLSDSFIDDYLHECGSDILSSVGCYHLEGRGVQLFERIDGDYFTILGMPLLKLLHFCRTEGLMLS